MTTGRLCAAATLMAAAVTVGCAQAADKVDEDVVGVRLPCDGPSVEVPPSYYVMFDAVALPASPRSAALQTSLIDNETPSRLFAKAGLWYRPDMSFSLTFSADVVGAGWASASASPARRVTGGHCPNSHDWIVVPGGFWTDKTTCTTVEITAGDRSERVQIGVGSACDGQDPPPQPNDT